MGSADITMPGFRLTVLDDALHPVPSNTLGVLAIHPRELATFLFGGYWNAETPSFQGDWILRRHNATECRGILSSARALTVQTR